MFAGLLIISAIACKKNENSRKPTETALSFSVNGLNNGTLKYIGLNLKPEIKFNFSAAINPSSLINGIVLTNTNGDHLTFTTTLQGANSILTLKPSIDLKSFSTYTLQVNELLKSADGGRLINPIKISLTTGLDEADKFERIPDDELLTLVQKQTFKYFWDFAHPVSGLARERNTSGNLVTIGGSGFGVMAIITGIHRGFISRTEGLTRIQRMVAFLKDKATRYHGAFPHWLDGETGATIPFSAKDNGADLVETSLLMQGLITARQYFNEANPAESSLRADINAIYEGVEWDWFMKDKGNVLYWHWSPTYNWEMNLPIRGWNECLITYVMAASAPNHNIPKAVYDEGWAKNGAMKNGNSYYGVSLPLGVANGGPLFLSHYSFLGINPNGLRDAYADYEKQTRAHSLINYNYCVANPAKNTGYGPNCWGLTSSDVPGGYSANSPNNDKGVIAPTAALSSFPYTPKESMQALHYFYYKLGDKIWGEYGFNDSFNLNEAWFASSTLAINQGPIMIMIENYRSKLLWDLFMSAPEVKSGMKNLGFSSPNL